MMAWVAGLVLAFASGVQPPSPPSVSSLNAHRAAFAGKEIVVRGYMWIGPEELYIVDRRFDTDDAWAQASGCLSLLNVGDIGNYAARFNGKYVEVRGLFVDENLSYGPSLMVCGATGIDLHGNPGVAVKVLDDGAARK